jgi:hypothetical protein
MLDERPSIFIRDKPIFYSETILYKDYDYKGLVAKNIYGREHFRGLAPRQTN